jgi:hypothetical protein
VGVGKSMRRRPGVRAGVVALALAALAAGAAVTVVAILAAPHRGAHRAAAPAASTSKLGSASNAPAAITGCLAAPSACGFPDGTNTGVPAGTTLSPKKGSITATTAGAVIDGLELTNGRINIDASGVTVKNTKITTGAYFGVHLAKDARDVTIEDVTIVGTTAGGGRCDVGIDGGQYTAERVNVSGCADGLHVGGTDTVRDSWVHDFSFTTKTHNDGIQVFGAAGVLIDHNTIDFGSAARGNAAIFLQPTSGAINGVQIIDNLLNGAGYTVYVERSTDVTVVNNRLGRKYKFGWIGTAHAPTKPTVAGNVWDDSGALIPL